MPEPERIEENGEIYYQVALNGPDILTAITNTLDSLSTPGQASQELAQMHIWDVLGIEPIPNLRYVRYLIDQQSENIWNSHLYWQYFSHFNLAIKWSDDVDDDNTTFLTLPLPSKIYLNASFDDNGNQVVWDIRLSENELRGAVYFGDLQTAAFTLVDSQQDMTLHVDYCVFDFEHYDVTIRWRKDQKSPTFQAKLVKNHKYHDLSWPGIPLISIRFSSNEIIFSMQDDHCQNKVQGSLYWLDDRYYLNIRFRKQTSGPSEIYEFHAETNPLNKGTSALNVKWSCEVFSENLDQTAEYGGILDCTYTAVLQSEAAPADENPAEVNTIKP
ncbi:MAG TPA: hypothetical protein PKU80_12295 [Candidatus Limiplasma sp.]|nr:hypothetical protein [Candidatus Limiplasma sp.]